MRYLLQFLALIFFTSSCVHKEKVMLDGSKNVYPKFIDSDSKLEEIFSSKRLFEAPVWDKIHQRMYFTGYEKGSEMLMLFIEPGKAEDINFSKGTGGTFIDLNPNYLLTANGETHQIMRFTLKDKVLENQIVLAHNENWFQPNDLCQTIHGDIYFTDPDFKNKKDGAVYHLSKNGTVKKVIFDLPVPNGIIASNDGKNLFVSDSHLKEWRMYNIKKDGALEKGKIFFKPTSKNSNSPDGMTIDFKGNLYLTGLGGIWIVNPKGKPIGFIAVPEFCTNIAFGDVGYNTLYITCYKKVYRFKTNSKGFIPRQP